MKMGLALNNLQRLMCNKTQQTKPINFQVPSDEQSPAQQVLSGRQPPGTRLLAQYFPSDPNTMWSIICILVLTKQSLINNYLLLLISKIIV